MLSLWRKDKDTHTKKDSMWINISSSCERVKTTMSNFGNLRGKQLFTFWTIDCHYDYHLPRSDTTVTGLRLEIWLANPAGWAERLRLSEDQGKLCWGRGVNWSVTPFPMWMTSRTNENHSFLLSHSPALHKSLFEGHWLWKQHLVS